MLLFLLTFAAGAQTPHAINYSIEEGLPSSNVYSIFQDSKGYIWFATDVGVVQFNGRKFTHYNTDDGLADNEVFKIHEDRKGRLWFMTLNGKLGFFKDNRFYNEKNAPYLKSANLTGMHQMFYQDSHGDLYFADRFTNMVKIDASDKKTEITKMAWKPGEINNSFIFDALEGPDKKPRYLMYQGLADSDGKPIRRFNRSLIDNVTVRATHLGQTFFFNAASDIYSLNEKRLKKLFTLPANDAMVISFDIDRKGNFWIGTRKGVYLVQQSFSGYRFKKYFEELSITKVLLDRDGNYWFSSLEQGVFVVPDMSVFKIDALSNKKISRLEADPNQRLWAGSFSNTYYQINGKIIDAFTIDRPVDKNIIKDFLFMPDRTYIIGNQASASLHKGKQKAIDMSGNAVHADKDGNIWWGMIVVFRVTPAEVNSSNLAELLSYEHYNERLKLLKRTNSIIGGKDDEMWIGTNYGLYCYTPKDSMQSYSRLEGLNVNIEDLCYDASKDMVTAATNSQGIVMMRGHKIVAHFTKRNHLSNNSCRSICKAGTDSYWVGTNTGLDKIYFANGKYNIVNYNAALSLDGHKINDIEVLRDTVYLATDNGIIYFNQYKPGNRKAKPTLHLTGFKANGKSQPIGPKVFLNYDQNELSIAYDGISFLGDHESGFHYKLEGADENWLTTTNSQINYKALPPGDYVFKIYLTDALLNKSSMREIRFCIHPPFWKTVPFLLVFVILGSALLFYIWRIRLRKLEGKFSLERKAIQAERDKATLEKEMIELEQKALRLQMNPHFIFNALNTIKGYYAEGNDLKASDYISKFSKLLRLLLENTDQQIALSKELEMLELYIALTQIRYKNKFDFEITVDPSLNPDDTSIPALLLQPMVENAIIHGLAPKPEKGMLRIRFGKQDNLLVCIVDDDGIGRTASRKQHKEYISMATEITTERIVLLQNEYAGSNIEIIDKRDENGNAIGTKVVISIPLTTIW